MAALLFVVGFWLASGVLSAAAYVGAQAWAPPGAGGRAGDFMALTFQARALTCSIRWDVVVQQACSRMREFRQQTRGGGRSGIPLGARFQGRARNL